MRPYWKGYLKLALVSCPIALHTACSEHFPRGSPNSITVSLLMPAAFDRTLERDRALVVRARLLLDM